MYVCVGVCADKWKCWNPIGVAQIPYRLPGDWLQLVCRHPGPGVCDMCAQICTLSHTLCRLDHLPIKATFDVFLFVFTSQSTSKSYHCITHSCKFSVFHPLNKCFGWSGKKSKHHPGFHNLKKLFIFLCARVCVWENQLGCKSILWCRSVYVLVNLPSCTTTWAEQLHMFEGVCDESRQGEGIKWVQLQKTSHLYRPCACWTVTKTHLYFVSSSYLFFS